MKQAVWLTLLLLGAALIHGQWDRFAPDDVRVVAAPPLSLEGYLDEVLPDAPADHVEVKVDNSACYVCHDNYDGEELVLSHAKEEVGCVDCHGPSYEHRDDEDNITPPDKMYALADVDPMCATCHDVHDAPAREVIQRWKERCPAKTDPNDIVCTDCHGEHRLALRTVWWNKKTGELIIRKEGQRTKAAEALTNTTVRTPTTGQERN